MNDKTKRESSQTKPAAAPMRQLATKAEELATLQRDLKQQLDAALEKAHELHQKTVEEKSDLGGEG